MKKKRTFVLNTFVENVSIFQYTFPYAISFSLCFTTLRKKVIHTVSAKKLIRYISSVLNTQISYSSLTKSRMALFRLRMRALRENLHFYEKSPRRLRARLMVSRKSHKYFKSRSRKVEQQRRSIAHHEPLGTIRCKTSSYSFYVNAWFFIALLISPPTTQPAHQLVFMTQASTFHYTHRAVKCSPTKRAFAGELASRAPRVVHEARFYNTFADKPRLRSRNYWHSWL